MDRSFNYYKNILYQNQNNADGANLENEQINYCEFCRENVTLMI